MVEPILVTAGSDFKIWETASYSQIYTFTPEKNVPTPTIFSTSWSTDTTGLASIIKDEDKVLLTFNKNSKYVSHEIITQGVSKPTFVQFPRTSQKHLYVSSKNELHFFDMTRHKSRKSFALKSDISCFVPNHSDAYLAIGCDNGSIVLLNTASNQTSQPFTAPKCAGQRVTCVKYSPRRTSFLGSACESGTVSFWDCNVNKNIFNINDHLAPCTSFAFSPVNDSLAASCGLDKKLICHDTKSRKSVFNLVLEQPCTAVDFDMDGTTVAVGTSRGRVVVYDLRNTSHYSKSLQAHNGKISALSYKPRIDKMNVSQVMSAVKSTSKSRLRSQKSLSALKTVEEESKENHKPSLDIGEPLKHPSKELFTEASAEAFGSPGLSDCSIMSRRDSLSSQLFSPLKETEISFNTPNPTSRDSSRRSSEVRLSTEGLFSPLRDDQNTPLLLGGRRTPFINTPAMSPLTSIQEETSSALDKLNPGLDAIFSSTDVKSARDVITPARSLLISQPFDVNSLGKPVLSSTAFESKSVGVRGSEKLSLDTLTQVARSLTCGESSPEFEDKSLRTENPVQRSVEIPRGDLDNEESGSNLVKPLGSNRCRIRDEDRNKHSPDSHSRFPFSAEPARERSEPRREQHGILKEQHGYPTEQQLRAKEPLGLTKEVTSFSLEQDTLGKELHSVLTAFPGVVLEDSSNSPDFHSRYDSAASVPRPFHSLAGVQPPIPIRAPVLSSSSLEGSEPGAFNRRFVEEVVSSAMEEWASSVENRITNMHYSVIRILQQHQEDTRMYIEELSGMQDLRRENELLKRENENLKRFF